MSEVVGSLSVELKLERSQFDRQLNSLKTLKGGAIPFAATLDTQALRQQIRNLEQVAPKIRAQLSIDNLNAVESQLRTITRDRSIKVGLQIDDRGITQQLQSLTQSRIVRLQAALINSTAIGRQIGELIRDRNIRVGVQIDERGISQQLEALTQSRLIRLQAALINANAIENQINLLVQDRTVRIGFEIDERKLPKYGDQTFKVTAIVDDKQLTALNKHLDLKQKHFTQVNNYFASKPLIPKIDLSYLDALSKRLDEFKNSSIDIGINVADVRSQIADLKSQLSAIDVPVTVRSANQSAISQTETVTQKVNTDTTDLEKGISKSVEQGFKKAKPQNSGLLDVFTAPIGQFARGFQEGIGLTFAQKFAEGSIRAVEKTMGRSLDTLGEKSAQSGLKAAGKLKSALIAGMGFDEQQLAFTFNAVINDKEVVAQAKNVETAIDGIINKIVALKAITQDDLSGLSKSLQGVASASTQVVHTRNVQAAATKAQDRAIELINDPQFVSDIMSEQGNQRLYMVGGLVSKKADPLADSSAIAAEQLSPVLPTGTTLQPVGAKYIQVPRNRDWGEGGVPGMINYAGGIVQRMAGTELTGDYADATEIAAQMLAISHLRPELATGVIGHSGGGFVAKQATEIAREAYPGLPTMGMAIGTPGYGVSQLGSRDFTTYVGDQDWLSDGIRGVPVIGKPQGLRTVQQRDPDDTGEDSHQIPAYVGSDQFVQQFQQQLAENRQAFELYTQAQISRIQDVTEAVEQATDQEIQAKTAAQQRLAALKAKAAQTETDNDSPDVSTLTPAQKRLAALRAQAIAAEGAVVDTEPFDVEAAKRKGIESLAQIQRESLDAPAQRQIRPVTRPAASPQPVANTIQSQAEIESTLGAGVLPKGTKYSNAAIERAIGGYQTSLQEALQYAASASGSLQAQLGSLYDAIEETEDQLIKVLSSRRIAEGLPEIDQSGLTAYEAQLKEVQSLLKDKVTELQSSPVSTLQAPEPAQSAIVAVESPQIQKQQTETAETIEQSSDELATKLSKSTRKLIKKVMKFAGDKSEAAMVARINQLLAQSPDDREAITVNPRQISKLSELTAQDYGHLTRLGVDDTALGVGRGATEIGNVSKKAGSVIRQIADSEAGQAFIGGLRGSTRALIAVGKAGYRLAEGAEAIALDMIPMGRTAKGVLQQTAVPALAFGAATHFLPGGGMVAEGMQHLAQGAISPLMHMGGDALSGQATDMIAQVVPKAFGMQAHMTEAVTGLINGAIETALGPTTQAVAAIAGGKVLTGVAGNAVKGALPSSPAAPALPPASKPPALPAVNTEPQAEIVADPFQGLTNPQLLAASRKLGIKGINSKSNKDQLLSGLKSYRDQGEVDRVLEQVRAEVGRDGKPVAGFDQKAEAATIKRLAKVEKDLNKKIAQLATATGKRREKLINDILSGTQNAIAEIDQLKGQNLSGETVRSISALQGRLENSYRNNPTLNDARNERIQSARSAAIQSSNQRNITGLARTVVPEQEAATLGKTLREGFRRLTNLAAKQFEVQPQSTIKGTLGAIAKSPKAQDLAVNTVGFAASQIGAKYGIVPELTGDLVGALVARQAFNRGRASGRDLTGDIAGFGVGNIAARSINAGLDAMTGIVPGAGVLRALPFKGALAASAVIPKVTQVTGKFQKPEGLARVGSEGLIGRFKGLFAGNQQKADQLKTNYEAIYQEIAKLSGVAFDPKNLPKLSIDPQRLKAMGADAFYDIEQNTIVIDQSLAKILSGRANSLRRNAEKIKGLVHEGRHSVQLQQGQLNLEQATTGQGVRLTDGRNLSRSQRQSVEASVNVARRQGASASQLNAAKALETDAYAFEANTGKILARVSAKSPLPANTGLERAIDRVVSAPKKAWDWLTVAMSEVASRAVGGLLEAGDVATTVGIKTGIPLQGLNDQQRQFLLQQGARVAAAGTQAKERLGIDATPKAPSVRDRLIRGYSDRIKRQEQQLIEIRKELDRADALVSQGIQVPDDRKFDLLSKGAELQRKIQLTQQKLLQFGVSVETFLDNAGELPVVPQKKSVKQRIQESDTVANAKDLTELARSSVAIGGTRLVNQASNALTQVGLRTGLPVRGLSEERQLKLLGFAAKQEVKRRNVSEQLQERGFKFGFDPANFKLPNIAIPQPLKQLAGLFRASDNAAGGFREQLGRFRAEVDNVAPGAGKLLGTVKNLAIGFVGFQVMSSIVPMIQQFASQSLQAAITLERLKTSLNFSTGNSGKALGFINKEADRLGLSLQAAQDGYTQLAGSTRGTAVQGKATDELFSGVGAASTVLGLTGEQQGRIFNALSQTASKGKLSAEELRGQIGDAGLVGSFGIAARSLGISEAELNKRLEMGAVTAEEFLPKFGRQLQVEFGGSAESAAGGTQASINKLQNSTLKTQQALGGMFTPAVGTGAKALAGLLDVVANNLDKIIIAAGVFGATFLAPMAKAALSLGLVQKGLGLVAAGAGAVRAQFASMALQFVAITAAIEGVRAIGEIFQLDEVGQGFKTLADQGEASMDRIAEAARKAAGIVEKTSKPRPSTSKGFDFTLGLGKAIGLEDAGISLKSDDLIKASRSNPLVSLLTGGVDLSGLTTVEELQQQRRQIEAGRQSLQTTDVFNQVFSGQIALRDKDGNAIKDAQGNSSISIRDSLSRASEIDKQIASRQAERNRLAAQPRADRQAIAKVDEDIKRLNEERSRVTNPVTELQSSIQGQITGKRNQLQKEGITGEEKQNLEREIADLEKAQAQLTKLQNSFGTAADRVRDLTIALAEMGMELEAVQRNAEIKFNVDSRDNLRARIKDFTTDENASLNAGVSTAKIQQQRSEAQLQGTQKVLGNIKPKLETPEAKQVIESIVNPTTGKNLTTDSSIEEIERAKAGLGDSDPRRKMLDDLIAYKRALAELPNQERQVEADRLATLEAAQQQRLGLIEREAQKRELANRKMINADQVALINRQKNNSINEEDVAIESAKISGKQADSELSNTQTQLQELNAAFNEGTISAEQFAQKRMELEGRVSDLTLKKAQAELAVREAINRKILNGIERTAQARELATRKQTASAQIGLINQQKNKSISEEDAAIGSAQIGVQQASAELSNVQQLLSAYQSAYKQGAMSAQEFATKRMELEGRVVDATVRKAQEELAVQEAKNRKVLEMFERRYKMANAQIDQNSSDQIANIKTTQLNGGMVGEGGQAEVNKVEMAATQARMKLKQEELQEVRKLRDQRVISEKEASDRELAIEAELRDGRSKLIEQQTQEKIRGIQKGADSQKRASEAAITAIDSEKAAIEAQIKVLEMKQKILETQKQILQTVSQIRINALEGGADRAKEAFALFGNLQDKKLGENARAESQRQLKELGYSSDTDPLKGQFEAVRNRVALEQEADRERAQSLLQQQKLERASLEIGFQKEQLAARLNILEAKRSQIQAQQNLNEAKANLQKAKLTGDENEIANAQSAVDSAAGGVSAAAEQMGAAIQGQAILGELQGKQRQLLGYQQQLAIEQMNRTNAANDRRRRLELATAADQAGMSSFNLPSPRYNEVSSNVSAASSITIDQSSVVNAITNLGDRIDNLANRPSNVNISTPTPVDDYADFMNRRSSSALRNI